MKTFQIIGTIILVISAVGIFYGIIELSRHRQQPKKDLKRYTVLFLFLALAAWQSAFAASTFTVTSSTSGTTTTFTITRSESTTAETVYYRTVSLSAMEGQNFNAVSGSLNFADGETSKTVSVTERTGTGMYQYAAGSGSSGYRLYRFEVLDENGFLLAYRTRSLEVTRRVLTHATSGTYDLGNERNGTFYFDGPLTITDDGYNKNPKDWPDKKYLDLPSTAFYDASTQAYLVENRTELRMTLDFWAYEAQDGYQYVQVLTDNTSTCDSGAGDGDPGTIQLSRYMAGFEIKTGSAYTGDYKKFTFPVLTVGNNEGHTNPWGHGTDFPLSKQKFNPTQQWFSSSTRASDGKIILNTNFNTIVLRFDASGSGEDNWVVNNVNGHVTAVDEIAPVANNNQIIVSPGPYNKGNDFYISVPFTEIVLGRPTLNTTWGDATYFEGDGTNVLTFKGTITAVAGTTLSVTGYSGSAPWDLFHNDLAGTISKTFTGIVSTDFVRDPIGSIAYSTTLGAYEINSVANLNDLAVYVNGNGTYSTGGDEETTAHNCEGMTFKMTADIDFQPTSAWDDYASLEHNCNAIGYIANDLSSVSYFSGTFDGQDHTISGIRNNSYSPYSGLFGCISGTVQNVKIANTRITGYTQTGGIVGDNYYGTVSNCHAAHNVAIRTAREGTSGVGGIVGTNLGTVNGCTSAAVITCTITTGFSSFGGIVGINSSNCTVSGCTATGVVVPDVNKSGAVIGENIGTVSGNQYHSSMVGNYAFNIGSGAGDIDGATLNTNTLMLYTERDNSALLAAYAATYNSNSSTAHGGTRPSVVSLNVTLKGYTLHKDGSWNTIALPFDFTAYSGSPLSGATIKQLDTDNTAYDSESGVLQVAFKTVTVNTTTGMDRTKPYIVKWSSGTDVADPTFTGVDGRRLSNSIGTTTDAPLIIRGSSKPFTLTDGMLLDAHNADNLGCHAAIVLSAPETAGYTFDGWFTDENCTVAPTVIPFGTDGSFSLYAKWLPNVLTIEGYGTSTASDHWAFIASPIAESISPTAVGNLVAATATEYDLYRLNPGTATWENYKNEEHTAGFVLENGKGYLYANKETVNLVFSGTVNANTTKEMTLSEGFNLVGNPFAVDAYIDKPYYTLNADGSIVVATPVGTATAIPPFTGVIVQGQANEKVIFSTTAPDQQSTHNGGLQIALSQPVATRGNTSIKNLDNAIVSFDEGSELGKFYFGKQNANICIPQGGKDYAIVTATAQGELPLNFVAKENATYTLTITNPLNSKFLILNYLHLIDNMTGADIDLLQTPSYTFEGRTTDYASRFKLVYVMDEACNGNGDDFAFISDGELIVNGEGTLQIIDMLGHVLLCRKTHSDFRLLSSDFLTPGIYVLQLVNGEKVKTQKIVVR